MILALVTSLMIVLGGLSANYFNLYGNLSASLFGAPDVLVVLKQSHALCQIDNKNACYQAESIKIVSKYRFTEVISALETIQRQDTESTYHDFIHFLGSNEYQLRPDIQKLFSQCSVVYFNSCYHGVVTGFLEKNKLAGKGKKDMTKAVTSACESLREKPSKGLYQECSHGLGHGLMLVLNNDLPTALQNCDLLGRESNYCQNGVFMENFPNTSSSDHPSKYLKTTDILYPCNSLEEGYLNSCYLFLSNYFLKLNNGDMSEEARMCLLIPELYRWHCYRIMGSSVMGGQINISEKMGVCNKLPTGRPRQECINGVVSSFADRFGGDTRQLGMFEVCKVVDSEYSQPCYSEIGRKLKIWLTRDEQLEICSTKLSPPARDWCLDVL